MVPQPCLACRLKLVEVDAWPTVFGAKCEARPAKEDAPSEASSTGGLLRRNDKKSRHRNMMTMTMMMMMRMMMMMIMMLMTLMIPWAC